MCLQGSRIEERIYEVKDEAGQPIQHEQFVQRVQSMSAEQVRMLLHIASLPVTYDQHCLHVLLLLVDT